MAKSSKIERAAQKARIEAAYAATREVVARGTCPSCGRAVKRNSTLAGWYQCEQYGSQAFRADPSAPSCDWQGFTGE